MNIERVKKIADAVLYEGYMLYPYRASAIKNQKRFNFGTLYPAGNPSGEPDTIRMQCLVIGEAPRVSIVVRFLHLLNRDVFKLNSPAQELPRDWQSQATPVASIQIGETLYQTWQESVEREICLSAPSLSEMLGKTQHDEFSFGLASDVQPLENDGSCVAVVRRSQASIAGYVEMTSEAIGDHVFKLTIDLRNSSKLPEPPPSYEDNRLDPLFASAHMILGVEEGEFISAIDPPAEWAEISATCQNRGLWPVLAGDEPNRDCMLAAPIILYDYPQIASQSPGDFFDGTEIDEMLTLRVMTMTDHEKLEMRSIDERARQILERTESMTLAQMRELHGASKVN